MRTWQARAAQPIWEALCAEFPRARRGALKRALQARDVRVNGVRVGEAAQLRAGDTVTLYVEDAKLFPPVELTVLFQNEALLVVEKPAGLSSVPDARGGETLLDRASAFLAAQGETDAVYACHRLDHNTGGIVCLARTPHAQAALELLFRERLVQKEYECIVRGCPEPREAECKAWMRKEGERVRVYDAPRPGAKTMITRYEVLETAGELSRLRVQPRTGRMHQIRAQLAHLGYPILGDDAYGDRALNKRLRATEQRLWACALELPAGTLGIDAPRWCCAFPYTLSEYV